MRHHLEFRTQHKIAIRSALMTWLVSWAADVTCRDRIQANGRTSYDNVTGHKGLQPIAIFREKVMFPIHVGQEQAEEDGERLGI